MVECRVSNVQIALLIRGSCALKVRFAFRAYTHIILNVSGIAGVLIGVVGTQEVISFLRNAESFLLVLS